jgi:hypothetical protein
MVAHDPLATHYHILSLLGCDTLTGIGNPLSLTCCPLILFLFLCRFCWKHYQSQNDWCSIHIHFLCDQVAKTKFKKQYDKLTGDEKILAQDASEELFLA